MASSTDAGGSTMTVTIDGEGRVVDMSPSFSEEFGFSLQDHVGSAPPFPWWPTEDRQNLALLANLVHSGFASRIELGALRLTFQRADGSLVTGAMAPEIICRGSQQRISWCFTPIQAATTGESARLETIARSCQQILENLKELGVVSAQAVAPPMAQSSASGLLSPREREILRLLLEGSVTADVASALSISPHTARNHTKAIFRKLGVHSQIELLRQYRLQPRA